jgi:phage-related protein
LEVPEPSLKPVHWVASSRKDLRTFPEAVQRAMGYALFRAQEGKKASTAKPWRGVIKGAGVLEIVEDHDTNTFRVLYTVRFAGAVYVLPPSRRNRRRASPHHSMKSSSSERATKWRKSTTSVGGRNNDHTFAQSDGT